MLYSDEKDYIMRIIKEVARVLFSMMLGKKYVQVELPEENKYQVSGRGMDEYKDMVDRGEINEAENFLLEDLDYSNKNEVAAAIRFYQYISEKGEEFLKMHGYSEEEALEGLKLLAEKAGYEEVFELVSR
ncbi:MAG: DUF6483 family protein [Eubacteriales bacterium]|nr:DUF6483 family protein [Eubacteriales bacterium]